MRIVSTLKPNDEYDLNKAEKKIGFYALYRANTDGDKIEFPARVWLNSVFPWTRVADITNRTGLRKIDHMYLRNDITRSVLRRDNQTKTFTFKVPFADFGKDVAAVQELLLQFLYTNDKGKSGLDSDEANSFRMQFATAEDVAASMKVITGEQISELIKTTARNKTLLKEAVLTAELSLENSSRYTLWVTFKISQKEAEYINSSSFLEIKLGNFYQILLSWVEACFGETDKSAEYSTPVSQIAASLKSEGVVNQPLHLPALSKVNDKMTLVVMQPSAIKGKGGAISQDSDGGGIYCLPTVDQALTYEQLLQDFGLKPDGSYSMTALSMNKGEDGEFKVEVKEAGGPKLPTNMPILTDWVNKKFAYSNGAGNLQVMDLEFASAAKAFNIRNFLMSAFTKGEEQTSLGGLYTALITVVGMDKTVLNDKPKASEMAPEALKFYEKNCQKDSLPSVLDYAFRCCMASYAESKKAVDLQFHISNGKTQCQVFYLTPESEITEFRFLGRIIQRAAKVLEENLDAAYKKYSVLTIMQFMAMLQMVAKYAPNIAEIEVQDKEERKVYTEQGLDPAHKLTALPLIQDKLTFLPHQAKTENLMRNSPPFAIWNVSAGGGKTIITITNILKELLLKHTVRPLILCPAHLVDQYVKEVVYVTHGRLNIIPLTNASMKQHGPEALTELVDKAPPNTVCVTDMNFIKNRPQEVAYGNETITLFRNVEFLRALGFDMIVVDESHYLANPKSGRRQAAARLMADIPMKRLASGTFVSNTPSDVVSQFALFDPTVFGSKQQFAKTYGSEYKGDKILAFKPGATETIRKKMNEHCVYVDCRRKEWAAWLPTVKERFLAVDMTQNQRELYTTILNGIIEEIKEKMKKNPELQDLMDSDDEAKAEQLEQMLKVYMVRLEQYMSSPADDPLAELNLKDAADMVSPKIHEIYKVCREHLDSENVPSKKDGNGVIQKPDLQFHSAIGLDGKKRIPGKILIFTNFTKAAENVYEFAPPDLKARMILYTADTKIEARAEFENDPKKDIMVGVSSSMDTGLNLQHASRLIRLETVWTPGAMEQGNSRINRPDPKNTAQTKTIFIDWICINQSIDVTKISRLISKMIVKAKYDNFDIPEYVDLPDLPSVSMSLENISEQNDFETKLLPYMQGYAMMKKVEYADFEAYRAEHPDVKMMPVPQNGLLPGSKLISRVPYIPGMDIYGTAQLGLVRYDEYMRQDLATTDEDEESSATGGGAADDSDDDGDLGEDGAKLTPKQLAGRLMRRRVAEERLKMKDRPVHTEFGDGTITGMGPKKLWIVLSNGEKKGLSRTTVYVITRSDTNGIDMRDELLKMNGDIPLDKPISVPAKAGEADEKRAGLFAKGVKKEKDAKVKTEKVLSGDFDFTIINDFLGIRYISDGNDTDMINVLSNFKFNMLPQYYFAKIKKPATIQAQLKAWIAAGYVINKKSIAEWKVVYNELISGGKTKLDTFGVAARQNLNNFHTRPFPPNPNKKEINPFPVIQDGQVYFCLPIKGQAGSAKAITIQKMAQKFSIGGGESEIVRFVASKEEASSVIKEMLAAGIKLNNLEAMKAEFKTIKLVPRAKVVK